MLYKVKLKNAPRKYVLIDDKVYKYLTTDKRLKKLDILNNLRLHSTGCAVFQKTYTIKKNTTKTLTIYLHRLVAEKFIKNEKTAKKKFVSAKNGNKLDCRITNLTYRTRSSASRHRKTGSNTGYIGVYKDYGKYRAAISHKGKSIHLGMYNTPKAAAIAYNEKSIELYGDDARLNPIGKYKPKKEKLGKITTLPLKKNKK